MIRDRRIYMIADDFTGAADAANYFCTGNWRVRVSYEVEQPWVFSLGTSVVQVFDAESRTLEPEIAAKKIEHAIQLVVNNETEKDALWFKKVDSTLRGNIGAEIVATLRSVGKKIALLAPAFPTNGRTVRNGSLFVNGVPISKTPFGKDPHNPVTEDEIVKIVGQTADIPVLVMGSSVIQGGSQAILDFLNTISHHHAVVIADTESDHDLATIAQAIENESNVLPCGSAGLAKQLASIWCSDVGLEDVNTGQPKMPVCTSVVVAVGSANPVSAEQLQYATAKLQAPITVLSTPKLAHKDTHLAEIEQAVACVSGIRNQVLGVTLAKERVSRGKEVPGTFEGDLAEVISHWLKTVLDRGEATIGLVATGGDTAFALCEALSTTAFWPQGELLPGMPWSWIETKLGDFPIVSKAGGFGSNEAIYTAVASLLGQNLTN